MNEAATRQQKVPLIISSNHDVDYVEAAATWRVNSLVDQVEVSVKSFPHSISIFFEILQYSLSSSVSFSRLILEVGFLHSLPCQDSY